MVEQTQSKNFYTPHKKENRFFSPWMKMKDKSFFDVLGWKLFTKTNYTKEERTFLPNVIPNAAQRIKKTQGDFILWIGHNTFLIRINNQYWMTDPIFSKRALLPARLTSPALTIKEFNLTVKDVNIIISHNHYDHLDRASIKQLPENAPVYVPMGLKKTILGMNKTQVTQMDWWQEIQINETTKLVCLPAQHWSMRISQGINKSLWASWLLITPKITLYFGGDTGYFKGFREIAKKYSNIDYAFMPTTAYRPRWFMHYQHMNIQEGVKGFDELGARFFIPTQWGTFPLGSEPAGFPGLDLSRHIAKEKLNKDRFNIMDIGQILKIN